MTQDPGIADRAAAVAAGSGSAAKTQSTINDSDRSWRAELVSGEAGSAIAQDAEDAERECLSGTREEDYCVCSLPSIVDVEMDEARAAVDGKVDVTFADICDITAPHR